MASLNHFDCLLGEALEQLVEASNEIRNIKKLDKKNFLIKIGRIIAEIWSIREEIYRISPETKRDFVQEHENDKNRFRELDKLHKIAFENEKNGEIKTAIKSYQELYVKSHFGFFKLLSEAGLYRCSKQ